MFPLFLQPGHHDKSLGLGAASGLGHQVHLLLAGYAAAVFPFFSSFFSLQNLLILIEIPRYRYQLSLDVTILLVGWIRSYINTQCSTNFTSDSQHRHISLDMCQHRGPVGNAQTWKESGWSGDNLDHMDHIKNDISHHDERIWCLMILKGFDVLMMWEPR